MNLSQTKKITRNISGILLFDKPIGMSSNVAMQKVKRLYQAEKAGHTGSLDPLATGLLPICFGEATKYSQYLLLADKTYQVTAKLGIKTTTSDAEGEVIATKNVPNLSKADLQAILKKFTGEILQVPSMYSALKHQGQPLYRLARKGVTIDRPARKITIHSIKLIRFQEQEQEKTQKQHHDHDRENELQLEVSCSSGTYIRNLIEDIGDAIGCGAHVIQLRRISVGEFTASEMYALPELQNLAEENFPENVASDPFLLNKNSILLNESHHKKPLDQLLLPVDIGLRYLPAVTLEDLQIIRLRNGLMLEFPEARELSVVRLYTQQNEFLGLGEVIEEGKIIPKRLLRF